MMANYRVLILSVAFLLFIGGPCSAGITITVFPSVGPNWQPGVSPGFTGYVWNVDHYDYIGTPGYAQNAFDQMGGGVPPVNGNSTDYAVAALVAPADLFTSDTAGYTLWKGVTPAPGPFAGEYGNNLLFGVHIVATGTTFTLADVKWKTEFFGVNNSGTLDSYLDFGYSDLLGVNGVNQYGAATFHSTDNPLPNTLPLTELFFIGFPLYFEAPASSADLGTTMASIWQYSDRTMRGTYKVFDVEASASVNLVPEPGSFALMGLGIAALGAFRLRRGK